jgi:two-component system LytT family sensor kinase
MEYDNDRLIPPISRTEIILWTSLTLLNPIVNAVSLFPADPLMWLVLTGINLLLLPAYLLFAHWAVKRFLFQKKFLYFILVSAATFLILQALLASVYALITKFKPSQEALSYFTYAGKNIARESVWGIIQLALATGIAFVKKSVDEEHQLKTLRSDNTAFKLKYLRSQLNPHFLFNTLNSIYSLSMQKSEETPGVVVKLADIMRYMIYECNEARVPLEKEIEFIRNYIDIEKVRYKADVRFTIEGNTAGILIEPLLFISFIENGFKHALHDTHLVPFIYISLKIEKDSIVLNVVNNTNLEIETQAKRIHGTGITNSKSLLELLYPQSYALNLIQTDMQLRKESALRFKHAKERLEKLYPDAHTLDLILNNNAFTVSLIVKTVTP